MVLKEQDALIVVSHPAPAVRGATLHRPPAQEAAYCGKPLVGGRWGGSRGLVSAEFCCALQPAGTSPFVNKWPWIFHGLLDAAVVNYVTGVNLNAFLVRSMWVSAGLFFYEWAQCWCDTEHQDGGGEKEERTRACTYTHTHWQKVAVKGGIDKFSHRLNKLIRVRPRRSETCVRTLISTEWLMTILISVGFSSTRRQQAL